MKKSILIIEDNLELRENTEEILVLGNYNVETAENGKIGVQKALSNPPDLVICDIMMPVMDGYEVLYLLRRNEVSKHIPFIFLTAKTERSDRRKGMSLGADDYLVKPFNEMELLEAIEARLEKYENVKIVSTATKLNFKDVQCLFAERIENLPEELRQIKNFKEKDDIFLEGDYISKIPYLERGKVKTYRENAQSKMMTTDIYSDNEFFGFIDVLNGKIHRMESAKCIEDCKVRFLSREQFESLIFDNHELSVAMLRLLSGNLNEKHSELVDMAYNSVRKRVSDALIKFSQKFFSKEGNEISLLREDLASMAGTSTESTIRVLSDLKSESLIEIEGRKIRISNLEGLKDIYG